MRLPDQRSAAYDVQEIASPQANPHRLLTRPPRLFCADDADFSGSVGIWQKRGEIAAGGGGAKYATPPGPGAIA